ncbi:hypothetical protein HCN44_003299 [Aphidius gifuensis]|uniref:Cadherin domain-containing protein n=1 Tax=Aphidius gifuensis TaxID=684658 RepID=A0A834XIM9_APHGI|nr:DE-cadherin-like [Aphidius gifuensis]KAF7987537.1 hypothetical protein HCN44_003299 [Aphidius gifuensis]
MHKNKKYKCIIISLIFLFNKLIGSTIADTLNDHEKSRYKYELLSNSSANISKEDNESSNNLEQEIDLQGQQPGPQFTSSIYIVNNLTENYYRNMSIVKVQLSNINSTTSVTYKIRSGNINQLFGINEKTGNIYVNGEIDYEITSEYTLIVEASINESYEITTTVIIIIENTNDNAPVFEIFQTNINILEEHINDSCIGIFKAHDPDIKNKSIDQNIRYYTKMEDRKQHHLIFSIDELTGCMTLNTILDRDPPFGYPTWRVIVEAYDRNDTYNSLGHGISVDINLIDVNDNPPILEKQQIYLFENKPPGMITKLVAFDYDSEYHSSPFTFFIDNKTINYTNISDKFAIKNDELWAKVKFDYKKQSKYDIPILITDSGTPKMTGLSILSVIIVSDDDKKLEGRSTSVVIRHFNGSSLGIDTLYVPFFDRDDSTWDDKTFQWDGEINNNFDLNFNTGKITPAMNISDGNYQLKFKVFKESETVPRYSVKSTINITFKKITQEAFDSLNENGYCPERLDC